MCDNSPAVSLSLSVPEGEKEESAQEKRAVPVVFCADAVYGAYLPVTVQSVIANSSAENHYRLIILDCGIGADILAAIAEQIGAHANFSLEVKNIRAWLAAHSQIFHEPLYFTKAIYGRLIIPEILPDCAKVIYADSDMVLNRDIAELMAISLGDNYIAAVEDCLLEIDCLLGQKRARSITEAAGLAANDKYINSGLLVFNAALWRRDGLTQKILCFMAGKELILPDQDAINAVCKARIHYLPLAWNCLSEYYLASRLKQIAALKSALPRADEIMAAWQAALAAKNNVLHYNGPLKPWAQARFASFLRWWDYAAQTKLYSRYIYDLAVAPPAQDNKLKIWKVLGMPLLAVKARPGQSFYLLGGRWRIAKKIISKDSISYYIFGIKLLTLINKEL